MDVAKRHEGFSAFIVFLEKLSQGAQNFDVSALPPPLDDSLRQA